MRPPATQADPASSSSDAAATAGPRLPAWLLALLLVLMTIAVYWPATRCGFIILDDDVNVTANEHVRHGLTGDGLRWAFLNFVTYPGWHPLTVMSHEVVCQFFGLNPWAHHLVNVLLHALNAGLVFALLKQMTGATWRSLFVAALFAVHPLRVEAVAWVTERRELLTTFFGLLALMAYVRYAVGASGRASVISNQCSVISGQSSGAPAGDPGPPVLRSRTAEGRRVTDPRSLITDHRSLFYVLTFFLWLMGLMSKPTVVTWPFVMLLLDYWPLRRFELSTLNSQLSTIGRLVREKIPFFLLLAFTCVVTMIVHKLEGVLSVGERLPLSARLGNAVISYCRYLGKTFWPTDLAVYYPHPGHWPILKVLLAGGLLLGISVLAWAQRGRRPYLLVGWLWYCGTLVPMSQVIQVGAHAMADRWTYIPSLGLMIIIVWGVADLTRRWPAQGPILALAGAAAIVVCAGLTHHQIRYWGDSEFLLRHTVAVTENNFLAHRSLGAVVGQKGKMDEAILHLQEAIRLKPESADSHNSLGAALDKKGRIQVAARHFQEAIRLNPRYAEPHYNLGIILERVGRLDDAVQQYQEAVRLQPDYPEAHNQLGIALARKRQTDEAIRRFQEAIRLRPDYAEAHFNLGLTLNMKGLADEAIGQFESAVRAKPNYPEAHNWLGVVLCARGRASEAIPQFQEALRLKPDYAEARKNLEAALGGKGAAAPPAAGPPTNP